MVVVSLIGAASQSCSQTHHTHDKPPLNNEQPSCVWPQIQPEQEIKLLYQETPDVYVSIEPPSNRQSDLFNNTFTLNTKPFGVALNLHSQHVGLQFFLPQRMQGNLFYLKEAHKKTLNGPMKLSPYTRLAPLNNSGSNLRVRVSHHKHRGYQAKEPMEFRVDCSELALKPTLPPKNERTQHTAQTQGLLTSEEPIALRTTPNDPIHGFIITGWLDESQRRVLVLERRKDFTRIQLNLPNRGPHINGWISNDRLTILSPDHPSSIMVQQGPFRRGKIVTSHRLPKARTHQTVVCDSNLSLWFKRADGQKEIGVVHKGTRINIHHTNQTHSMVSFPDAPWIRQIEDVPAITKKNEKANRPNIHTGLSMLNADLISCVEAPNPIQRP